MEAHHWQPLWPQPAPVGALFTLRGGGVSTAPWYSWNLGGHVGDDPGAVRTNRARLAQQVGGRPVFLEQVHGVGVVRLQPDTPDGTEADACWTDTLGVACTVMVADCLPVLFTNAAGDSVAAAHAGWRGLAGQGGHGVLEALLATWPAAQGVGARAGLQAWLGPCIGPTAFEVGPEVRAAFGPDDPRVDVCFAPQAVAPGARQTYLANLPALARLRLEALGVRHTAGNDGSTRWCTVSNPGWFFSHRRDAAALGSTGRMAACIWRL